MVNTKKQPYFDTLVEKFESGDIEAKEAFGKHIHWGYWADPRTANGSLQDFAIAAENLSIQVCNSAQIENGMIILDAGCGFGGTISNLNNRFNDLRLTGINIDKKQVDRAKKVVQPQGSNLIDFVHGDACQLPFPDNTFDRVLAVECIFAFPSRLAFFKEVNRVLKPEGRLSICDFLPIAPIGQIWNLYEKLTVFPLVSKTFGKYSVNFCTVSKYKEIAKEANLILDFVEDITFNTLPTYSVVNPIMARQGDFYTILATKGLSFISKINLLKYIILSFKKR